VIADAPLGRDGGTAYPLQQFWEIRIASPYLPQVLQSGMTISGQCSSCRVEGDCPSDFSSIDRAEDFAALWRFEGSGRPLGTAEFVTGLERLLGRPIARRSPRPKRANRVDGEQLELLQ
jgi:hypothetical protein